MCSLSSTGQSASARNERVTVGFGHLLCSVRSGLVTAALCYSTVLARVCRIVRCMHNMHREKAEQKNTNARRNSVHWIESYLLLRPAYALSNFALEAFSVGAPLNLHVCSGSWTLQCLHTDARKARGASIPQRRCWPVSHH
jgi:hypothetical protein